MASCECCDDPEPGEFRLLIFIAILALVTGSVVLLRPWFAAALTWLREQDLLVPAAESASRLPGDVGVTWLTLGIGFGVLVAAAWLVVQVLRLLGVRKT